MYAKNERFIYELIQNADDACLDNKEGNVVIEFTPNFLVISHSGKAFDKDDIRSISSVGKSQKENKKDNTGYKDIGFKSVFGKSELVYIHSGGYFFRFDKNKWKNHKIEGKLTKCLGKIYLTRKS